MGLDLNAFHVQGNYLQFVRMSFHCIVCLHSLSLPPKVTLGFSLWEGRFPKSFWAKWSDYSKKPVIFASPVWFLGNKFLFVCFQFSSCDWLILFLIFCLLAFWCVFMLLLLLLLLQFIAVLHFAWYLHFIIKKKIYLCERQNKRVNERDRKRERQQVNCISLPLVYYPNSHNSQIWARSKSGDRNFTQVCPVAGTAPILGLFLPLLFLVHW